MGPKTPVTQSEAPQTKRSVEQVLFPALEFVRSNLDQHLKRQIAVPAGQSAVAFSRVVDDNGQSDVSAAVGLTLVRLEQDRVFPSRERARRVGEELVYRQPEMAIVPHLLFSALPNPNYDQMLLALSGVLSFFQGQPIFTSEEFPALAQLGVGRITVEFESLQLESQSYVWSVLGAKYLPSAHYLLRFVPIQDERPEARGAPVTITRQQVGGR